MRIFSFCLTLGVMASGFLTPSASAGVAAELAVAGCGSVASSMLTTQVAVDPHHLTFSAFADEGPSSQTIVVECYDPSYYYNTSCGGSLSVDQPWLRLDRTSFYGTDAVAVTIDPSELTPGTYEARIQVSYDFVAIDDGESVSVELVVQEDENQL